MSTRFTPRALGAVTTALLATLALSSCAPKTVAVVSQAAPAASSGVQLHGEEARFVDLLNAERARAGLAPLTVNAGAVGVARGWAGELARRGGLAHNPSLANQVSSGVTAAWVRIAENVGMGADADSVHQALVASPPHRGNMLDAASDLVGVGIVRTGGTLWLSMVFIAI